MRQQYTIILHLQAPLQIGVSTVLHDEGKMAAFAMTLVAALKEAELLCTVVLDNSTGTIIPHQHHYRKFAWVLEINQTVSNNAS